MQNDLPVRVHGPNNKGTMPKKVTAFVVNTFADDRFPGSPTGVVPEAESLHDEQMLELTRTLGVSHVAFLAGPGTQTSGDVEIRFFTPNGEIKNCAHATIAAHFLLWTQQGPGADYRVSQKAQTGFQEVHARSLDGTRKVFFKQSTVSIAEAGREDIPVLLAILGLKPKDLSTTFGICLASPGTFRVMVPVTSIETLLALTPDFPVLGEFCSERDLLGCFVFTLEGRDSNWEAEARMFAPAIGVPEDRINGNSAGCLGAYVIQTVEGSAPRISLSVFQGHHFEGPGQVAVEAGRTAGGTETLVGGTAVIKSRRELWI